MGKETIKSQLSENSNAAPERDNLLKALNTRLAITTTGKCFLSIYRKTKERSS